MGAANIPCIAGLPVLISGKIIKGFGRGSKELGIPTANFPMEVVRTLPKEIKTGVYFGWAQVEEGPVHKMVMSIGWNPYYQNKEKSMETHIIHKFPGDLYGRNLKVAILGFLRPETNFKSLDDLIEAIKNDISNSETILEMPNYNSYKTDSFFKLINS